MTAARPQSFASNALITIGAQGAVMMIGLFASVLISRVLGAEGRGTYYVPVTAVTVTFALMHLSVEMAVRYFHAERIVDLPRLARVSASAALVLGGLGFLILAGPYLVGVDEIVGVRTELLALAAIALPFTLHATWLMNLFVLSGHLPRSQAAMVAAGVLQTVALLTLWATGGFTVERVLVVYVLAAACSWALLIFWSRSFAPAIPTLDRALIRRVVGHGLRIHGGFLAYFLLLRVDVFLIQGTLTVADVGHYSLAVLFAELIGMLTGAIAVAGLPFQSAEDRDAGATATYRTVRVCLLVASVLAVLSTATMWFILPTLYGEGFQDAYGPLVVLLPGVVAMTVVRPMWNWLVRDGRPAPITILLTSGLVLNVVLNLLLLPRIGLYGASVASSISYGVLAVVLARWTLRSTGGTPGDLVPGRADLLAGLAAGRGLLGKVRGRGGAATDTAAR